MTELRALVFDLDGTLIESDRDIAFAVNQVLEELGLPTHSLDSVRRMIGHGVGPLLAKALAASPGADLQTARDRFFAIYAEHLVRHTRVYEGVDAMLAEARARGLCTAVATNKPARLTKAVLERLGLSALLDAWASADEVPKPKPDPGVIRLALGRAGFDGAAQAVAYVGDMPVDVETSRAFGATTIGAGWGFDREGLLAAQPDVVLATPREVLPWLFG